jgi:hypothetical protein
MTLSQEDSMIEGLRLDVTADEIVKLIDERITQHTGNAATDEADAKTFDATARTDDEDDEYADEMSVGSRLRRRAQRERERADALSFMRNHVVRGETYRLTNDDLRTLEILPGRYL